MLLGCPENGGPQGPERPVQSLEQMARSHRGHTLGCAAHGLCDCGHGWSGAQGYPTLAGSTAVQSSWDLDPPATYHDSFLFCSKPGRRRAQESQVGNMLVSEVVHLDSRVSRQQDGTMEPPGGQACCGRASSPAAPGFPQAPTWGGLFRSQLPPGK